MIRCLAHLWKVFRQDRRGTVFVEAIIVLPVITIFAAGVFEFGNVLWQRHQIQVGVRDAARYLARCPADNTCSQAVARNIAFFGKPVVGEAEVPRVPGWPGSATNADFETALSFVELGPDLTAPEIRRIQATGQLTYLPSPWFGALGIGALSLEYSHIQRLIGR